MRIVWILFGVVAFASGVSSGSAVPTSVLRSALRDVPQDVLAGTQPFAAEIVDLRALRGLAKGGRIPRQSGSFDAHFLVAFLYDDAETWARYTGLRPDQPASALFYHPNDLHHEITVWQFIEKKEASLFLKGLQGRGFAEIDGQWRNGEPLTFVQPRMYDDRNPFVDRSGYAPVLAQRAASVVQEYDPQIVRNAVTFSEEHSLASAAPVRAALDAVDEVSPNGVIVQAIVLSPSAWLTGPSPEKFVAKMLRDPKRMSENAEEMRRATPKPGVPPTLGALLVNIEVSKTRGALIVLPYADCRTAEKAGTIFADLWRNEKNRDDTTARSVTGAEPVLAQVKGGDGCSEVVSLLAPTTASPDAGSQAHENLVWRYILMSMLSRDFAPFRL